MGDIVAELLFEILLPVLPVPGYGFDCLVPKLWLGNVYRQALLGEYFFSSDNDNFKWNL